MTRLVASEYLKFRTTRAWIGFVLAMLALTGVAAAATVGSAPDTELGTVELSRDVVESALFVALIAFLIGILSVTTEWRHGTATRTFLVTPRRYRVLVAKEIWVVVLAFGLAVLALLFVLAIAVPWLVVEGSSLAVRSEVIGFAGRVLLVSALWGALGVGIGAVVQSQTPALVGSVVWILLGEALITLLLGLVDLEGVGDYLPGRALSALDETVEDGLSPWAGGAVGAAWVVTLGLLGVLRMSRQDVT